MKTQGLFKVNRSVEPIKLQELRSKTCVHTKNIYSMLDLPIFDDSFKRLSKHIESCSTCALEFKNYKKNNERLKAIIPEAVMDKDLNQTFESEIVELFHTLELSDRAALKKKVKNKFKFIDQMGIDFLANLTSKTMIKYYLLGAVVFLGLKHLL